MFNKYLYIRKYMRYECIKGIGKKKGWVEGGKIRNNGVVINIVK